jgi:hypothetical protein
MSFAYWIPVIIGAVIFIFGIGLIIWGAKEGTNYYDSLINGFDLREFSMASAPGTGCINNRWMDCHYCRYYYRRFWRASIFAK